MASKNRSINKCAGCFLEQYLKKFSLAIALKTFEILKQASKMVLFWLLLINIKVFLVVNRKSLHYLTPMYLQQCTYCNGI